MVICVKMFVLRKGVSKCFMTFKLNFGNLVFKIHVTEKGWTNLYNWEK